MSIDDLIQECSTGDPEYRDKMLHPIPPTGHVDREKAILNACSGKVVLDIGYAGSPLHRAVKKVAKEVWGVDQCDPPSARYFKQDLNCECTQKVEGIELVLCGEVLEHLSNPGAFLDGLRLSYSVPVLLSVPNAFSEIAQQHARRGVENVNLDHVAWYSWRTLSTLLARHGWKIDTFWWYGGGDPPFSEGLLVLAR